MRHVLLVMLAWLCLGAAQAQTTDPPPLILPPAPDYAAPPSTLLLPADYSLLSVEQARGNLARWRDAERRRMGAYIPARGPDREAQRVLPGVGGYFALFADTAARPGIAYGYWSDPASGVGSRSVVRGLVLRTPYTICGGQLPWAGDAYLSDITYLGNEWRSEFDALDSALGDRDARVITGRELPAGEVLPFAPSQQMPDISRFYPVRALEREIEGVVSMSCRVEADFTLRCGVVGVDLPQPPLGVAGWRESYASDFGQAAIRVMQGGRLRVVETTADGQPSAGACVRRRIRFAFPR